MTLEEIQQLPVGTWIWVEIYSTPLFQKRRDYLKSGYYRIEPGPGREYKVWIGGPIDRIKVGDDTTYYWRAPLFFSEHTETWNIFQGRPSELGLNELTQR